MNYYKRKKNLELYHSTTLLHPLPMKISTQNPAIGKQFWTQEFPSPNCSPGTPYIGPVGQCLAVSAVTSDTSPPLHPPNAAASPQAFPDTSADTDSRVSSLFLPLQLLPSTHVNMKLTDRSHSSVYMPQTLANDNCRSERTGLLFFF